MGRLEFVVSGLSWWFAPFWIAGPLGFGLCMSGWPQIGVTLTPDEIVVRSVYRTRRIPWSSIDGVMTERWIGGSRVRLRGDGINLCLPAPITDWVVRDRQFEEKSHGIGLWWLNHAADGRPMEPSAAVGGR